MPRTPKTKIPKTMTLGDHIEGTRQVAYFVYSRVGKLPPGDVRKVQEDFEETGFPVWDVFDFRQIVRVSKIVKNLKELQDGVEQIFGDVGSNKRNLFLSDWRSLKSAVGRLEGLRFKSPAGKKLFAGMLARWKREVILPQFRGHPVKPQLSSLRTRSGSHSRGSSAGASDYRTPPCTRRCPVSRLYESHSADGTRARA